MHVCVCMCFNVYVCLCMCMYLCVSVCIYVYMHLCVSACVFVYMSVVCVVLGIKLRASHILGNYSTTELLPALYICYNYSHAHFNAVDMSIPGYQTENGYCVKPPPNLPNG